jgi:TnpA family transposase
VIIYWHVDKKACCMYPQLRRHALPSAVAFAFAFSRLLGFELLPRLRAIHARKLHGPETGQPDAYPNLQRILTRPINRALGREQYDHMIKYATALRIGTAETEAILRRFTRDNLRHPTYRALIELGKAVRTVFLRRYVSTEALRREIHEACRWWRTGTAPTGSSTMARAASSPATEEPSMLSLQLHQISLVLVNKLMIQHVLGEDRSANAMSPEDLRP